LNAEFSRGPDSSQYFQVELQNPKAEVSHKTAEKLSEAKTEKNGVYGGIPEYYTFSPDGDTSSTKLP